MEKGRLLARFFREIHYNACIGPTHIALYTALYNMWMEKSVDSALTFYRSELMQKCKIAGKSTYHRALNDLVDFGYIAYQPKYDRTKSVIWLIE